MDLWLLSCPSGRVTKGHGDSRVPQSLEYLLPVPFPRNSCQAWPEAGHRECLTAAFCALTRQPSSSLWLTHEGRREAGPCLLASSTDDCRCPSWSLAEGASLGTAWVSLPVSTQAFPRGDSPKAVRQAGARGDPSFLADVFQCVGVLAMVIFSFYKGIYNLLNLQKNFLNLQRM